jgi:hypothetical protein
VPDRVAGEARERGDTIRHVVAANRTQREQIVESKRQVSRSNEEAGNNERTPVGRIERVEKRFEIEVAEDVVEHHHGHDDDREAEGETDAAEADVSLEEMRGGAQPLSHSALQARPLLH